MLDAFCMTALTEELSSELTGGRIDKVFQPERDEVHLAVRSPRLGNVRLLISVGSSAPRAHFTDVSKENPSSPPMFCMFLRKHLTGARIAGVMQPELERVIVFTLDAADEMGVVGRKLLIAELMGRHSNLIVVDGENRVLDCLRRVDSDMSERRPVLPGLFYHLPPGAEKQSVLSVTKDQFERLKSSTLPDKEASKWLLDSFWGLSPLLAREIVYRACGDAAACVSKADGLAGAFLEFMDSYKSRSFTPMMLLSGEEPADFSFTELMQYEKAYKTQVYDSFSSLLDSFYTSRDVAAHTKQRAQSLIKLAANSRDRITRKMAAQYAELKTARNKDGLRESGDLLTANFHIISKGDETAELVNFYDEEQKTVKIKLNPLLTPQQNAAKYYKDYNRMKTAEKLLAAQLEQGESEREYLESVLEALSRASGERDIQEIREELELGGYLSKSARRKTKTPQSQPLAFRSSAGLRFFAGRNNRQNDLLTLKLASKSDLWLHTQKIPGCHVVIPDCDGIPDEQTLFEAATVAAVLSQAKTSPKVPVDYTQIKYVKKPGGAKPGMVIYDKFQTILVEPDARLVEKLRV